MIVKYGKTEKQREITKGDASLSNEEKANRLAIIGRRIKELPKRDPEKVDVLTSSFEEIWVIAEKNKCDLRTASLIKGIKRVAAAKLTRGLFP